MYLIIDEEFPNLDTYLCYECGFNADTILMEKKSLYFEYQQLFAHFKEVLKPKKLLPTSHQQPDKTTDDSTESRIRRCGHYEDNSPAFRLMSESFKDIVRDNPIHFLQKYGKRRPTKPQQPSKTPSDSADPRIISLFF